MPLQMIAGNRLKKEIDFSTLFLYGFCPFFGKFGALLPTTCMSGGYSKRKSELACFFEQYRALKQKSSAPQGLPPPTQL